MENTKYIIINPVAGKGKIFKDWELLESLLHKYNIPFEESYTTHKCHALELTKQAVDRGFRSFIAVGGDGTLNEITNALIQHSDYEPEQFSLAMIPTGTGNDWSKTFGIPDKYEEAIKMIAKDYTMLQDIGKVSYKERDGSLKERYFINGAGIGYDARVAEKVNKDKEKNHTGTFLYMKNLMSTLIKYNFYDIILTIDDREYSSELFSLSLGIGKYIGGGMMMMPGAVPDSGCLDITLVKKISKVDVIKNVKNLYDGSFVKHPSVELMRGRKIVVDTDKDVGLEADGEILGDPPYTFEILPQMLNVVCGGVVLGKNE